MEQAKQYILRNILPGVAVMVFGITGAFFVYNVYFSGYAGDAVEVAYIEPAAGEEGHFDLNTHDEGEETGNEETGNEENNSEVNFIPVDVNNIPHYSGE